MNKFDEVFELIDDNNQPLKDIYIGANWDPIEKHGLFNDRKVSIDMDLSCIVFDEHNKILDTVYYYHMISKDGAIIHTGDDSKTKRSDYTIDNEVIKINLDMIHSSYKRLVFVLNGYDKKEFAEVPHMKIRVYDGKPNRPTNIYATADIYNENELFNGNTGMLIAEMFKDEKHIWAFSAIFELTEDKDLEDTIKNIKKRIE
jgi:tellurium resistance protein TerZ